MIPEYRNNCVPFRDVQATDARRHHFLGLAVRTRKGWSRSKISLPIRFVRRGGGLARFDCQDTAFYSCTFWPAQHGHF